MLKKLRLNLNDEILIILLGLIIAIYPLTFLLGNLIINLNTGFIAIIFIIYCIKNKSIKFYKSKYFILLILFWLSFIINLFFSSNFENSLLRVIGFLRFILLVLAIKLFFEICTDYLKNKVYLCWLIILLIISLDLIFEYFVGHNIIGLTSPMNGRLSGFLGDELKIGHLYLGFFTLCYVTFFNLTKNNLILTMFILFGIFVSLIIGERANFIRFIGISFIFFLFFENRNLITKITFLLFLILIILFTLNYNHEYKKRFYGQFINPLIETRSPMDLLKSTVYGANYDRGIRIFEKNKFFGVGINNFRIESGKDDYENKALIFNTNGSSTHPHQVHIEFLSETGIFGYLSFVLFILFSLFFGLKNFIKNKNPYSFMAFLYLVFSLTPILPSGSFFTTFGATIFWINYGLMINERSNLIKKH